MEGLLVRWALALQEYHFKIVYCKGVLHGNADSLSRKDDVDTSIPAATTMVSSGIPLKVAQLTDPTLKDTSFKGSNQLLRNGNTPP